MSAVDCSRWVAENAEIDSPMKPMQVLELLEPLAGKKWFDVGVEEPVLRGWAWANGLLLCTTAIGKLQRRGWGKKQGRCNPRNRGGAGEGTTGIRFKF